MLLCIRYVTMLDLYIVHKTLWMYCMWQRMKSLRTEGKTVTLTIVQDNLHPIGSSLRSATNIKCKFRVQKYNKMYSAWVVKVVYSKNVYFISLTPAVIVMYGYFLVCSCLLSVEANIA